MILDLLSPVEFRPRYFETTLKMRLYFAVILVLNLFTAREIIDGQKFNNL